VVAGPLTWRLRRLPVCASTEIELASWLGARERAARELPSPHCGLAVVARRQRFGVGQRGRGWYSPAGGLCVPIQIKWPNDLLTGGRKLAGVLPRLRLRGAAIRWAQVGVGLNGTNRLLPAAAAGGAISLAEALGCRHHPQARPDRLLARVLAGLDWARTHADQPELVRLAAEARLWRPAAGWFHADATWQVLGLHADGRLRLGRDGQELALERRF
jgi:BirA family biotin operon repressor/biotin-[acetyl-CoA-carboxylase] ligase